MATQLEKKKEYIKQALSSVEFGDDDRSFYLKIISSSLVAFYIVRIYNLIPALGSSLIDCDCPDHQFRQSFCKHMQVAFLFFLGKNSLLDWQVSFLVLRQLRELKLLDHVKVGHLNDFSLTIGLKADTCPLPRFRVRSLEDWLKVLPELLAEVSEKNVA